jgi:hypothetical protein
MSMESVHTLVFNPPGVHTFGSALSGEEIPSNIREAEADLGRGYVWLSMGVA